MFSVFTWMKNDKYNKINSNQLLCRNYSSVVIKCFVQHYVQTLCKYFEEVTLVWENSYCKNHASIIALQSDFVVKCLFTKRLIKSLGQEIKRLAMHQASPRANWNTRIKIKISYLLRRLKL